MEIIIKISDCKEPLASLDELALLIDEGRKKNEVLIKKGRTKIDMVGENCHVEINIKQDSKQLSLQNS